MGAYLGVTVQPVQYCTEIMECYLLIPEAYLSGPVHYDSTEVCVPLTYKTVPPVSTVTRLGYSKKCSAPTTSSTPLFVCSKIETLDNQLQTSAMHQP